MLIKKAADIRSSEITNRKLYLNRREFLRAAAGVAAAGAGALAAAETVTAAGQAAAHGRKLEGVKKSSFSLTAEEEKTNTWEQITSYNNYYEFGIDKDTPSLIAAKMKVDPWTVQMDGECAKSGKYAFDDLIKGVALEERVYRHRCVEAWSMVIPWVGVQLSEVLKKAEPTPKAKFVEFTSVADFSSMPGLRQPVLQWPYIEGLRMDEAMHPLSIFAVGLYGEALPKQDGAPLKLVVPWKYGFKGGKSIVRIRFTERQPLNSWQLSAPQEYGFYANVNPNVDHPRWSQASERRIGEFFKRKTLMFNGYGEQVASLYNGLDLKKNY
jgi:sulfoxide reductase catalytic subunit YedY